MILFQENWKQEVREYLRPFLVASQSPAYDEERDNRSIYELQVIEKHQSYENINGRWGEFILGNGRIHHLATPAYGGSGEDTASITWGLKSDFLSTLHFWAAAILVVNAFNLELNFYPAGATFFYDQNFFPVSPIHAPNLAEFAKNHWANDWRPMKDKACYSPNIEVLSKHDWAKNQPPLPAIVNAHALRSWLIQPKWNDEWTLFETKEYFILWNWSTGA